MNKKVKIIQIRSQIGRSLRQVATLESLGLGKIGQSKILELNTENCAMINRVKFLVKIEEL